MSESIEQIFSEVAQMTPEIKPDSDPFESEEYAKFVESMVPHCHCKSGNCPCDGVLAGGICDNIQDDPEIYEDDNDYLDL